MPDKSFEQAVSAELEGLRIKPDAKVWEVVAASLKREKKRRIFVWLLFLGVSVGGIAFWWYQNPTGSTAPILITKKIKDSNTQPVVKKEKIASLTFHQPSRIIQNTAQQVAEQKFVAPKSQKNSQQKYSASVPAIPIVRPIEEMTETTKLNNKTAPVLEKESIEKKQDGMASLPETNKIIIEPVSEAHAGDSVVASTEKMQNEYIQKDEQTMQKNTPEILTKNNKWQWNLLVEAGVGGFRNSLSWTKSSNIRFQPFSSNSPSIPGTGAQSNSRQDAAATRDAFSWSVQVQASKPIGKKNKIGLSAGYGLYRTRSGANDLVNQVHLLETGVELSRKILLFKTLSMRTRLGTGVDLVIASKGFRPADSTGRLGPKPSFNSIQPHVSAGFDFGLGKQPIVYIGPQFKYYIRGLYTLYGEPQHMVLIALRATVPLQKARKNK